MAETTLWKVFNELSISIPTPYRERMKTLMNDCFTNGNFIIIPKRKIIKVEDSFVRKISWEWCVINKDWMVDSIRITSDDITTGAKFEKLINDKELFYIEGKNWYSIHSIKKNSLSQKKLIDFVCSIKGLVETIQIYEKIWYTDSNTIIYSNGIVDLDKKEFIEKEIVTKRNNRLMFNTYEKKYDLVESCIGLSSIFDELITNKVFRFILKGFLVSSIFRNEIFESFESFPLFYLSGIRGKGKTFLLRLLSKIVGFEKWSITSVSSTTSYAFQTKIDEINFYNFMDESHTIDKNRINILKGNYDGNKVEKWWKVKWGIGLIQSNNDSVLFVWGEAIVWEESLQTRCIIHNFWWEDVKQIDEKEKQKIIKNWNNYFQNILINKKDVDIKGIIERGKTIMEELDLKNVERRIQNNLLIIICGNLILNDSVNYDEIKDLVGSYLENNHCNIEETISYNIIEDVINYFSQYSSILEYHKNSKIPLIYVSNWKLFLNFREIIKTYLKKSNQKNITIWFVQNQLLNYIWLWNLNLKENYWRFRLYDWVVRDLFCISKEEVKKNEILKEIWNRCIHQIKKEIMSIEETIRLIDRKSELKSVDYNNLENYRNIINNSQNIIEKNGLMDFEENIKGEIKEIFERELMDMVSVYRNHIKKNIPTILFDKEDGGIFFNINQFSSYFPKEEWISEENQTNEIMKHLWLENIWLDLIEVDWITGKTNKDYIKISKYTIESNEMLSSLYQSIITFYYEDKKELNDQNWIIYGVIINEEEVEKLNNYVDSSIKKLFDI